MSYSSLRTQDDRSSSPRRRRSIFAGLMTATLTTLGLVAAPPGDAATPQAHRSATPIRSQETASDAMVTGGGIVTLITGDRVRVTTFSDGKAVATMLPGSAHSGDAVDTVHTGTGDYVIPRLPLAERMRLDVSLFDVTALLGRSGTSVAVDVSFAAGTTPHAIPGLSLDLSRVRQTADGGSVVPARYSTSSTGLRFDLAAWRGVSSVSLAGTKPATAPASYRLHTLTVHVVTKQGKPVRFEVGWVVNMDDATLFDAPLTIVNGYGKISVPEGNYAVLSGDFAHLLVQPDIAVQADTRVEMSLADATVLASSAVPGRTVTDAGVGLDLISERRGGFGESIISSDYGILEQPVPAALQHGALWASVTGTFAPSSEVGGSDPGQVFSSLAFTNDFRRGVPASMSFTHPKADFAVVPQQFHANGPAGTKDTFTLSFAPFSNFGFAIGYRVHVPGQRTMWLQGSPALIWDQGYDPVESFGRSFKIASLDKFSRYTPGAARPVIFARGPVGPGFEAAYDRATTGRFCILCRQGNDLHGLMPLFDGAGAAMFGQLTSPDMGSWRLSHGSDTVDSGHFLVAPRVTLPATVQPYTLTATSHPDAASWQLSTDVTDVWHFTSGAGTAVVPLLMPSYAPRSSLSGAIGPGATSFPLDFGNLGPVDATVTHATASLSTDGGKTWRAARVTRVDKNSFAVSYPNPAASGPNRFMSLRVTGTDSAGRSVSETAINAYRLTNGPQGTGSLASDTINGPSRGFGPQVPGLGTRACATATDTTDSCYAVIMSDSAGASRAGGEPQGWGATDLEQAYDIPDLHSHQTVAVVVAYDYPTAEADLATYRRHYGLPACTTADGCFSKINERGQQGSYPFPDPGWSVEAALDMDMISAACPTCHIILAEADQPYDKDLATTTDAAVAAGADVTNHSYGISEHTGIRYVNAAYDHAGVTAVAASGDQGYGPASFPASSPDVIAVGGTVLHHADNPRGWRENAWRYGGSGCSAYFAKRAYQHDKACGMRTYSDLAAVAYGVAVYNSYALGPHRAWLEVAGTSISSPLVAGMVGAASAGGIKPGDLYGTPGSFWDTHLGSNGTCQGSYLCTSKPGYDGPTGWGTPRGLAPFSVG